jgi:hypothetical protein
MLGYPSFWLSQQGAGRKRRGGNGSGMADEWQGRRDRNPAVLAPLR